MKDLLTRTCEPCKKGAPRLTAEELDGLHPQIPDWEVVEEDGIQKLSRIFTFKDFASALAFVNRVGELAEDHIHHPTMVLDWGRVAVFWTTHKIKGLHENDVIMAAKTDALL